MYSLTLSHSERRAIDWIGPRHDHGDRLYTLLWGSCQQPDNAIDWDSRSDITFLVPEYVAWEIQEIGEECDFRWDCFAPELGNKLTALCKQISVKRPLDPFTLAYIECALWAETDNSTEQGGEPLEDNYKLSDIAPESLEKLANDCAAFQEDNRELLESANYAHPQYTTEEMAGHDFWLTRNRHGAGFWDRGLGDIGQKLTEAAHVYGECSLYVGGDGKIYCT